MKKIFTLFALLLSVRGIANFVTNYLWFDAIGFNQVWSTVLFSQIVLATIFVLLFGTIVFFDQVSSRYRNRLTEGQSQ